MPETPVPPPSSSSDAQHSAAHAERRGSLAKAVRATSLMTLLSRFAGLIRDLLIGRMFGDTAIGSAFAAGFAIPNMFRRLFGEGALSAAFVPQYADAVRTDSAQASALSSLTMAMLGLVTTVLTIVVELVLLLVLLLGEHTPERTLSIQLIMIMLPFMPLICMVAILAGMLQVHKKYAAAASGPVLLNGFIVVTGAYFVITGQIGTSTTAFVVAAAVVLSGITQLAWFLYALRSHVRWTRSWDLARTRVKIMLKKFVPVGIGLGTLQLNTFIDTLIAMWPIWVGATVLGYVYPLDQASNAILSLTARLYQFPLGVFGIAIATAAFPLLAYYAKEPEHFIDTLRRGLRLSLFIALPATIGLILIRHDVVAVLFGSGKTSWRPESIERASSVLLGFSVGIWAYALNQVFTRALYAQGDTKTPMKISLMMIGVNLTLNLALIWWLQEAGLAWATAISSIGQTLLLWMACSRMLGQIPGQISGQPDHAGLHTGQALTDPPMIRGIGRIILCTLLMGAAVFVVLRLLPAASLIPTPPANAARLERVLASLWVWQLIRVGLCVVVGGGVYILLAKLLRLPELGWILHREKPPAKANAADDQPSVGSEI